MSYRFRFFQATKDILKLRKMSYDELKKYYIENEPQFFISDDLEGESFNVTQMFHQKEFFDFATLPFVSEILKSTPVFFENSKTNECFQHYNLHLCDEQTFLLAIDCMRKQILTNYKELLEKPYEILKAEVQSKIEEWQPLSETLGVQNKEKYADLDKNHFPYNTDKTKKEIVSSWLYEYQIFELVRIYKEFDWKNNCLLIYGW